MFSRLREIEFKGWFLAVAVVVAVSAGMLFSVSFEAEEVIASQGQESEPLRIAKEGLIGYWSFDEKIDSVVSDISGYSNDGTITAVGDGTIAWVEGRYGHALQFNGVDSSNGVYINCGNSDRLMPVSEITVMAWIKVHLAGGGCILRKRSGASASGYVFETYIGKIRLVIDPGEGGLETNRDLNGTTEITTGTWCHVAGTYDGRTLKVYVNGVLDGSSIYKGSIIPDPDNFYIGYRPTADLDYFRGAIDEVKVYSRVLLASEIKVHYNMSKEEVEKIKESLSSAIEDKSLKAEKLVAWLGSGEGRTLLVNPSFLFPPFANGKPIYESKEERDEYYLSLGIWKKSELKEYQVKEISWVDSKLPLLKPGVVKLKALLPAKDIGNNLPDGSRILLKGKTGEGKEVPLIFEIARGKNRIINIAFSLSPNLEIEKLVTMSILGYIKTTGQIIPNIGCKAHTGYSSWQGTAWEGKGDEPLDVRIFSVYTGDSSDGRGEQKGELSSILFWSVFLKNSKPTFVGLSLVDEPISAVTSKLYDKVVNADIIRPKGMCMLSLDYSTLSASYYCSKVSNIVLASTDRITQWLIETLDGRDPVHTDLFRLSTESIAKVFFLRPIFWVEKELIHAFKIEEDKLEPVPITVDRKILVLESTGGNYLIYYGQIKEVKIAEFWKKFCFGFKDKKEIEGETPEDYSQYRDAFNVHWVEF